MRQSQKNIFRACVSSVVLFSILLGEVSFVFTMLPRLAHAAEVQIDSSVSTSIGEHMHSGAATVFVSDQVGYKFYVDSDGRCVYSKTTNGGVGWGGAVIFDNQTDCSSPVVWYDQWTPGDTGSYIHMVNFDSSEDDIWYNRLDTTSDTLLLSTATNTTAGLSYAGTLAAGTNQIAITKGTDGTIYTGVSDASGSIIVECTTSCDAASNWSITGTPPLDNQNDYLLMLPQPSGNIMLIRRDLSLNDIQYQVWDNVSWPGVVGWSTIDSNAVENTTYDSMMSAVVDDDFNIYLAYIDAANFTTANHDLRTAKYSGGSWSNTTDVTTDDTKGLADVGISLDRNTGDVYVAFSARTTIGTAATGNVYWASSTSAMSTWSSQQGPVNSSSENIVVDINHRSDERMYVSWYGETSDDMFGDTLADVSPQTRVSASGTQILELRASSTPTHIGGQFVIQEYKSSRFVNSITLTENGSVDGATGIGDIALYYDLDISAPYDCATDTYDGTESQFGATDTNGFSAADGTASFSDAVTISPTQALCIYPVIEVESDAGDGVTLELEITNPATDVLVSSGNAAIPVTAVAITGDTDIIDSILTQTHYHWRYDNGDETAATSRTSGSEDTVLSAIKKLTSSRIRLGISNEGSTSTLPTNFQLQYSTTTVSCDLATGWTDVSDGAIGSVPTVAGFQTTTSGASSVSSLNMTAPSGITAGELLLIIIANDATVSTAQFSDNVTDWNFIGTSGNNSSQAHIGAFWKIADGSEGTVTVTAQSSNNTYGWYIRIAGADTTNPINVSNFTQSVGNTTSHLIPQVSTSRINTLGIYGLSFDGGDGDPFSISGTGWSEQGELTAGTTGTDGAGVWGTKNVTAQGNTGNATVGTSASDGAAYFQLAINPRVNPTGAGEWYMSGSPFLTDGADTIDISNAIGGVTNENSTFLSPNGGIRTFTAQTGPLTLLPTDFTEFEYSVIASSTATDGSTYCFRVSDTSGSPMATYTEYPRATISADVTVSATGTQVANIDIPSTNAYIGGVFAITENASSRNVTSITLTENGTIDAATGLENIKLRYEFDTAAPYDCATDTYDGTESQFGATDTDGFSSANGTTTFTGSVAISTTSAMCVYPIVDVTEDAQNGETIDIVIESGSSDVLVSGGGSVAPATALDITSSTTLRGGIVSQTHYHWRTDNGSEVTASSSVGTEDTALTEHPRNTPIRLRIGIENIGPTTTVPTNLRLEYGIKLTTCDAVSVWTDVDASPDAWNMYDSSNLTEGSDTTDVTGADLGEISNPGGKTFLSPNGGVRDTSSETDPITLTESQFTELEYSITSTATTSYSTNYCFRVTNAGSELLSYSQYAELTTAAKRDFKVQRGTTVVTGTGVTITPSGSTYTAPASTSLAFVRITNMHHTGAGRTVGDNTQESDDETVYISDSSDLTSGFTLTRYSSTNNSVVSWEIVEFIGELGTDNEMRVRDVGTITLTGTDQTATGSPVSSVTSDDDVVVFITGIANANTGSAGYYNGQVTSKWNNDTNEPVFERIGAGSNVSVSYAVVEYTGINWRIQRKEHSYLQVNEAETELIDAVNSLSRTFLHAQKRMGAISSQASFGHEVWLSSIGAISFKLSLNAATTSGQVSVAWVIENTQTSEGKMVVQQKAGSITNGVEPRTTSLSITEVAATNNTSVFAMSAFEQNTNNYPRVLGGVRLASTTAFEIYNSDITTTVPYYYRVEIVEWPTTGLSVRQNYYRFYVNNDALDPTDPWPVGATDVGENTVITALDEPVSEGDVVRLRLTLQVNNAQLPAGLRTYKLQYGARVTTCSAIETWTDVGDVGSGAIWRGYDTSVTDGTEIATSTPAPGTLNISVSDVAGRFVEQNPSSANPYDADDGEDIEYDFAIQHNGAAGSTFYCFRAVNSNDDTVDGYINYPQLRTAGFTPVSDNWRWYDDAENETPVSPLAAEQSAPIDIANANPVSLRINVGELKNVDGSNTKFKLQFSEYSNFSTVADVVATSSCVADSLWCYADGGGVNNSIITTKTLTDSDACAGGVGDGCGTHNESADFIAGDTHVGNATREYEFVLQNTGARVNAVYYFRLYDVTNSTPVIASSSYPSLVTEGASLTFNIAGIPATTLVESITTDVPTDATSIAYGSLPLDTELEAAQQLSVTTNGTEGYQVLMMTTGDFQNQYGTRVDPVLSTNSSPDGWGSACLPEAAGCFGYHSGDDTLQGGSARFAAPNSYAQFSSTTPEEIAFSSLPAITDTTDIVYKLEIRQRQESGTYETSIMYIAVPLF